MYKRLTEGKAVIQVASDVIAFFPCIKTVCQIHPSFANHVAGRHLVQGEWDDRPKIESTTHDLCKTSFNFEKLFANFCSILISLHT